MATYIPLSPLPFQFQDSVTSLNMSGGTISFFLAGTATPTNLFSDNIGTSIGSSIPLNSGGMPESGGNAITLWRDDSINVKLVLKNAAGATIATSDNIGTFDPPIAYDAIDAVPLNLHDYIEDTGEFLLMGFVPQSLKSAIRAFTSTTDVSTYLQNSVDALVDERGAGKVRLPIGRVTIGTAIALPLNVSVSGSSRTASTIRADNCNAFTLAFTTGFGDTTLSHFGIDGVNGTTRIGIVNASTGNVADELYGVTLYDLAITNFFTCVSMRHLRNLWIQRVWLQHFNQGMDLSGRNLVVRGHHLQMVRGSGNGTTTNALLETSDCFGLKLDTVDYTIAGGVSGPEGVILKSSQIIGVDIGINANFAHYLSAAHLDMDCNVIGVRFGTVQQGLGFGGTSTIVMHSTGIAAVKGVGLASTVTSKPVISGFHGIGLSAATCVGVLINDSGNQNQNNVTTQHCYLEGFGGGDIVYNNAGGGAILNNNCMSTVPTSSISVPNVVSGSVYIDKNVCAKVINWVAAEAAAGEVILGHNTINGTTQLHGSQQVPTVASATALTLPLGSRDHEHFIISGTTNITSVIVTGWVGRTVTLHFEDVLTVVDGSNLALAGNFVTSSNDTITLACIGAGTWNEVGRSVN